MWQDFRPRIHVSESDFATITLDGTYCNAAGKLGAEQFEAVFRRMLKLYTQRQVSNNLLMSCLLIFRGVVVCLLVRRLRGYQFNSTLLWNFVTHEI